MQHRWLPRPDELTHLLRQASWPRMLLGHRVANGLAVGFGLGTLLLIFYWIAGLQIAASASVGMLVMSIGDQVSPARGKLRQLSPLLVLAVPLWSAMHFARLSEDHATLLLGLLICFGGFIGMLGNAWGARGAPMGFALVLAMIFALSSPPPENAAVVLEEGAWFELGALVYAGWAVLAAKLLNNRYRAQALADAFAELAAMLRQQSSRYAATADRRSPQLQGLLAEQAALADKLQTARDLVLDQPATPRQRRLASMLLASIRLREQALACELTLDEPETMAAMKAEDAFALELLWREAADLINIVCWSLYAGGRPKGTALDEFDKTYKASLDHLPQSLRPAVEAMSGLLHALLDLSNRSPSAVTLFDDAEAEHWPRFRTSMTWPMTPLRRVMTNPHSPVLRYALRVTVALAVGYTVGEHLPWATHPQWILLTIAVVMRTNLAQTLERRNQRLAGTTIGCVLVAGLLSLHPPIPVQFAFIALGVAVAHGFAQVRYLIAAIFATVLALLQGHLLHTATEFSLLERLADTFIGTGIAWAFSYVLPAWERRQIPVLIKRLRTAHLQQAKAALTGPQAASGNADWRLTRREVQDSLAAFALAAQRARSEPRAVQPPIAMLERLQVRSYRLLAQLSAIRLWREQPAQADEAARPMLASALSTIESALSGTAAASVPHAAAKPGAAVLTETLPADKARSLGLPKRLQDAIDEARAVEHELSAVAGWEMSRRAERSWPVLG